MSPPVLSGKGVAPGSQPLSLLWQGMALCHILSSKRQSSPLTEKPAVSLWCSDSPKPLLKARFHIKDQDHELAVYSGADLKFLDEELVRQLGIETEPLPTILQVQALDGQILHRAHYCTKPLMVSISNEHTEWIFFLVIPSLHAPVMFGFPWLQRQSKARLVQQPGPWLGGLLPGALPDHLKTLSSTGQG